MRAAAKKPAPEPTEPTQRDMQHVVMRALIRASADLFAKWSDPQVPKAVAGEMIANRLSYVPDAATLWDPRLPIPTKGRQGDIESIRNARST